MALPDLSVPALMHAGVHFGHRTRLRNPAMEPYLFGERKKISIIDLSKTLPMLHAAMRTIRSVVSNNGRVLFVGSKRQAQEPIKQAALRSAQYFVNRRWLGGTLTNWQTVSKSVQRLIDYDEQLAGDISGFTKKEVLKLTRERDRLELSVGGIRSMGAPPDLLVIIDTNRESIAVTEARSMGIPVLAVVDSNSNPNGIDFPVPGNDDSSRSIDLFCQCFAQASLEGISTTRSGLSVADAAVMQEKVTQQEEKTEDKA